MVQVVHSRNDAIAPASNGVIGSFIATAVFLYTSFPKVLEVPVVSNYVAGTIFEITKYVGTLTPLYAPWLSKMMAESTGASTATLLRVGSVALVGLEVVALAALVSLVLHLVLAIQGKAKPARLFGLLGYILALVVPAMMFIIASLVSWQMTNSQVSL